NRRAKETVRIECRRRTHDAQAGAVREERSSSLRMVDRTADITTVRHAHDDRRAVRAVRSPAHRRLLIAQLHVRRPDVIEVLNLDDWLEAAQCESDRASNDVRFGKR